MIQVNGINYKERETKSQLPNKYRVIMAAMMMMSGPMHMGHRTRKTDGIDIETEYGLIQQKKSTLTRSQRECVVRVFENKYERING